MVQQFPEAELKEIELAIREYPGGATAQQILSKLQSPIPLRTLQYRLKHLTDERRIVREGEGRWAKYLSPNHGQGAKPKEGLEAGETSPFIPLSRAASQIQKYVKQPIEKRTPAGYNRRFLDGYHPNKTFYLTEKERQHLVGIGTPTNAQQPAGTYAKQIFNRLLLDLAWNSSRLEGNTYSLLDTKRLIEFDQEAVGHEHIEAQMILNHKDAIEFLVGTAEAVGFNRYTILNLHALLANNLLADPAATGRLRYIAVGIERSVFHPLEVPQLVEECFDQLLATAAAIVDPFEQAFFVMVQLPYLQPFDDVNKRVSRLAANIPLIKANLSPLSFTDVPRDTYTEAVLGVYELNETELLKDVFLWAYERSVQRYVAVRQSLGEPDPFRLRYRTQLRDLVAEIIRNKMGRKEAVEKIESWTQAVIDKADRKQFVEIAESELSGLHEGNFVRYRIKPSEFEAWQKVWLPMAAEDY